MAWIRLDDQFADHPKFLDISEALADAAMALWVRALGYCNKHETDGVIPRGALRQLSYHGTPSSVADELVRVGLWTATEKGWLFHDYLDYQKSAAELQDQRAATSELRRKAGLKSGEARRRKRDQEQEPNSRRTGTEQPTNRNRTADEQEPNSRRTPSPIPSPEISPDTMGVDPETSEPTRAPAQEPPPGGPITNHSTSGLDRLPEQRPRAADHTHGARRAPPAPGTDERKIYDALHREGAADPGGSGPMVVLATPRTIARLAAHAAPGGRLDIEDVVLGIRQAANKERARLDAEELPTPRGNLASMLDGFVARMQRGEARKKASESTAPARASPRGRVTEFQGGRLDRAEIDAQQRRQREQLAQEDTGVI